MNHPTDCGCYRCKLRSLTFDTGRPAAHVKAGDPWKDNPVVERIKELSGVEINTDVPSPTKEYA